MTVLTTFLESSLNFLFNVMKKHYNIWDSRGEKAVSKFELPETQFVRTVKDKITCKTYLE